MAAPAKDWSTGFCDCFNDCGVCLMTCCCPCIQYGINVGTLDPQSGACCAQNCYCAGATYYLLLIISCCCLVHQGSRQAIKRKYGITTVENDCCKTMCCSLCAICQEAREIKLSYGPKTG